MKEILINGIRNRQAVMILNAIAQITYNTLIDLSYFLSDLAKRKDCGSY